MARENVLRNGSQVEEIVGPVARTRTDLLRAKLLQRLTARGETGGIVDLAEFENLLTRGQYNVWKDDAPVLAAGTLLATAMSSGIVGFLIGLAVGSGL